MAMTHGLHAQSGSAEYIRVIDEQAVELADLKAQVHQKQQLAIKDRVEVPKRDGKGEGKGGAKGGKRPAGIPENALTATKDGKGICIKWSNGDCPHQPCKFAHVCWFCEGPDHKGPAHRA